VGTGCAGARSGAVRSCRAATATWELNRRGPSFTIDTLEHLSAARGVEISSTLVRERVAAGYWCRYLVPDSIWRYVEAHGLYRR